MSGTFGSPYRAPCGGWPGSNTFWFGPPAQHGRAADSAITRYLNTTTVCDDYPGGLCSGASNPVAGYRADAAAGHPSPWPEPPPGSGAGPTPYNTYAPGGTPSTVNFSVCQKVGFKNVFARKNWHGHAGFTDNDGCCPAGDAPCCMDAAPGHADNRTNPPNTKYRTIEYSISMDVILPVIVISDPVCGTTSFTDSCSQSRKYTVDRYSGVRALVSHSDSPPACGFSNCSAFSGFYSDSTSPGPSAAELSCDCGVLKTACTAFSFGSSNGVVALANHDWDNPHGAASKEACTVTNTGITYELWLRDWDDCTGGAGGPTAAGTYNYNQQHFLITVLLSDPYTSDDINDDLDTLLGNWTLSDDQVYPWRTDGNCTSGPLMTYYEGGALSPAGWTDNTYTDSNAANGTDYDGSVLGAPTPAGYDPYYNFRATHYDNSCDPLGSGEFAPDFARHATQWTNCSLSALLFPGAFRSYHWNGTADAGSMYGAKWAEVQIPRPSHDYGRPRGRDRYATEQGTVRCVSAITSGVATIDSTVASLADATQYYVLFGGWSDSSLDGIYHATYNNATPSWTLGGKVAGIAGRLDDSPFAFIGVLRWPTAPAIAGQIAVVDASNTNPIQITLDSSSGGDAYDFFFAETGDQVTIADVGGNTAANGTFAITKISDFVFSIPAAGSGAYTSGGTVISASGGPLSSVAPAGYQWHDNRRKGDYLIATWTYNNRDWQLQAALHDFYVAAATNTGLFAGGAAPWEYSDGTTCTPFADPWASNTPANESLRPVTNAWSGIELDTECNAFLPCCPAVMCVSPNGEVWPNGTTFDLPQIACDDRFGSLIQKAPIQWMVDPLWEAPTGYQSDCSARAMAADDGSCGTIPGGNPAGDYAMNPWEEARATVPAGTPALPSPLALGSLSIADINSGGLYPIINPPAQNTCVNMPWIIYDFQQLCIAGTGPFACEYSDPEAICTFEFDE